jgi:hypothetical protein
MTRREWIGPREIARVLEVTDALGLHREGVRVPLDTADPAVVEVQAGKLVVIAPAVGDFEAFIAGLASVIRATPGVERVKRA